MSILTQKTGYNVSQKYAVITTQDLIAALQAKGMRMTKFTECAVRSDSKRGFQKHMLRFTHESFQTQNVGEYRPEIVLVNSYDGTSSFRLMLGIFRLVCSNGLVVGDTFESYRVRHVGNPLPGIFQAIEKLTNLMPVVAEKIKAMQGRELFGHEIASFTQQASKLVLPENAQQFTERDFTRVRRLDDAGNNLWTVYNRIQETAINGGVRYIAKVEKFDTNGVKLYDALENRKTRKVKAINRQVEINQELWNIAEKFAA